MELVVAGLSSKVIGIQFNISPKTVENHRAWVMERMGARNLAELIHIVMKIRKGSSRFGSLTTRNARFQSRSASAVKLE